MSQGSCVMRVNEMPVFYRLFLNQISLIYFIKFVFLLFFCKKLQINRIGFDLTRVYYATQLLLRANATSNETRSNELYLVGIIHAHRRTALVEVYDGTVHKIVLNSSSKPSLKPKPKSDRKTTDRSTDRLTWHNQHTLHVIHGWLRSALTTIHMVSYRECSTRGSQTHVWCAMVHTDMQPKRIIKKKMLRMSSYVLSKEMNTANNSHQVLLNLINLLHINMFVCLSSLIRISWYLQIEES